MRLPFSVLTPVIVTTIYALPAAALLLAAAAIPSDALRLAALLVALPLGYPTLFVLVAAAISRPFQRAIIPGKFPRDVTHPVYRARRIYGLCWTTVYYNKPLYFLVLSIPALRRLTFRAFGYRGQLDFTIYPDTWIRDLPLLDFGAGAYLANRATIGTNMALSNGTSFVDRITVGANATVGHLAVLAPGVVIGAGAEIGATAVIGIHVKIGERTSVQPCAGVNHAARIGDGVIVGTASYIGAAAVLDAGVHVAPAAAVPNRSRVAAPVREPPAAEANAVATAAAS
jgi:acyl-[acyl carrier protein]--UDP-N-acetylglucosamine O-acyltransferase